MRIHLVGTGISQGIPVIGCRCAACQSSDIRDKRLRTAAVIDSGSTQIAFDIGPDFRQQMLRGGFTHLNAVFVTHEHSDHVAGLDDIRPYNWILRGAMPLYAEERVIKALEMHFPYAFMPPDKRYPGAPDLEVHELKEPFSPVQVGDLELLPFRVFHGALPILGYRIGKFAYITDCSYLPQESKELLHDLDVLVINALRHTQHPMHLSLSEALQLIVELAPREAYLTHLSHEMGPVASFEGMLPSHVHVGLDGMELEVQATNL